MFGCFSLPGFAVTGHIDNQRNSRIFVSEVLLDGLAFSEGAYLYKIDIHNPKITCSIIISASCTFIASLLKCESVCLPRFASRWWDSGAEWPMRVRSEPGTHSNAVRWANPRHEPEAGRSPASHHSQSPSAFSRTQPGGSQQTPQGQVLLRCDNTSQTNIFVYIVEFSFSACWSAFQWWRILVV